MQGTMLRFGIIGLGYWGPNYARILGRELTSTRLVSCADQQESRLAAISGQYADVQMYTEAGASRGSQY